MSYPTRKREKRERVLYYLYCFYCAGESVSTHEKGLGGKDKVFSLSYRDLSALVSRVPLAEYSESALEKNLQDLEWLTPRVKHHERVLKTVAGFHPIIPVRFGTLYRSQEKIQTMLRSRYEDLCTFLTFVQDKEEWGVKMYMDKEAGGKLAQATNPALQALEIRLSSASAGERYFLQKRKEKMRREDTWRNVATFTEEVCAQLASSAVAIQPSRLLERRATGRDEEMIFNAAFLVAKESQSLFGSCLDHLAGDNVEKGIFFELSGPWPPYHFCPSV